MSTRKERDEKLPFAEVSLSERSERDQRIAEGWLRGAPALQSPPPDPHYGGRFPGAGSATPPRVVQLIAFSSAPLPLIWQFWESSPAGRGKRAGCHQP